MSLTLSGGPLSADRDDRVNYKIEGPRNLLFASAFPRRVRAVTAGETVFDTVDGLLLHESGLLPELYVPEADIRGDLVEDSQRTTICPFKGVAAYRNLRIGDRIEADALWSYPEPPAEVGWLRGYVGMRWDAADTWFDEDEEVFGHLRDPYHRLDVRRTSRLVEVYLSGQLIARSTRALVLSEAALPNRYYLPQTDVQSGVLTGSHTVSICAYKGTASYLSARSGSETVEDIAWSYQKPLDGMELISERVSFSHQLVEVHVDGKPVVS